MTINYFSKLFNLSYITNYNIPYITDPIQKAIGKYKFHPSILLIKEKTKCKANCFDFVSVTVNHVEKQIKNLNPNKQPHPLLYRLKC